MADALIGATIAERYQVVRKIGQGGMGAIYEVVHLKLKRSFVLKRLAATLADDDEALSRFQREAEVVASLRHPNIVEISDWDTLPDGAPCMILEYLRGEDLDARIEHGPLAWTDIFQITDQAMSALAVAHRAGVVHRDLKPQNIFLALDDSGEEHVKLLDFGISKIRNSARITGSQVLMGTPAYMSPEQAHGRSDEIGPATDVWALGALIYEMATGRQPFIADSIPSTLLLITTTPPPPILDLRPDTPPELVRLIDDVLSLDSSRRVQTIAELRRRISRIEAPSTPTPISSGPRSAVIAPTTLSHAVGEETVSSPRRRPRWIVPAAIVACLVGIATFVVVWSMGGDAATKSVDVASANPIVEIAKPAETKPVETKPVETQAETKPVETKPVETQAETKPVETKPVETKPPDVKKPAFHDLRIAVSPAGATVLLDGRSVRGNLLRVPLDGKRHRVVIRADGYDPTTTSVDGTSADLSIQLAKSEPKPIDL